ncbi:inactive phospholipase D5 isoform X3 [Acanthochromis polyacanthus]|uniref:inactive phospholipase D5 isoform X3 n=1 Tax=Acanthochromis polyacanthus TaxID=80966 RepID=UPI0022348A62|nr:inactive phospholipase D5 isoform X3 [Acanthochromis polyacanthus]
MELSDDPRSRGQDEAPPTPLPCVPRPKNSSHSAVQQQGYSASIFLRREDKLERTQQKCIAIFALLSCFAVLMALIFSSVDIWGDDEDGITEENCSRNCHIVLMENIPDDLSLPVDGRPHLPLSAGFHTLLDQAKSSVEVVSPVWDLNSWDLEPKPSTAKQGQLLFQRLLSLKSQGVKLKIASSLTNSTELKTLAAHSAEVHFVNMTALTRGGLHSSFWVVDRKHIYIGSADMDWRSLSKTSPEIFCAKDRTRDVDAIYQVIQSAKTFIFISVTDYLPLVSRRFRGTSVTRYWSPIDEVIREAVVLRGVRVRLLISFWKKTHPLTFNFVASLKSLCMQLHNCSLEVRFFSHKEQKDDSQHGLNNNKYMVTDDAVYIGNHDWVGSDFAINAGVGLVVKMKGSLKDRGVTVLEQVKAAFEIDWRSRYAKNLQGSKDPLGKYRNMQQLKNPMETKEENERSYPLSL